MFTFKVIPDDSAIEPFQVEAGMRVIRMWEKLRPKRSMGLLGKPENMTAAALFEIAHLACRQKGLIPQSMTEDDFIAAYEIDLLDDDREQADDEVPTSAGA